MLLPAARRVNSGSSVSESPESGGGRGREKKLGAALLAAAARAEVVRAGLSQEVRESERPVSSRAAAVAGVQQLNLLPPPIPDRPHLRRKLFALSAGDHDR